MNLQITNCTEVPPVKFQKPPGKMRAGKHIWNIFKIVICSGDCDLCCDPRGHPAPFPLSSSWWADAPHSEWLTEVMERVSKNTPSICEAVLLCFSVGERMQVFAQKYSDVEVISSQKPVLQAEHERALLGPSGWAGGHRRDQGRETWAELWKKLCDFCSYLVFFEVWGRGYVGDKWKDRRRGGKTSGAQYVLSSASPAHLQWETLVGFPERSVAAAASLSCGSQSNKGVFELFPGSQLCHQSVCWGLSRGTEPLQPGGCSKRSVCLTDWLQEPSHPREKEVYRQYLSDTSAHRKCCTNTGSQFWTVKTDFLCGLMSSFPMQLLVQLSQTSFSKALFILSRIREFCM